METLAQATSPDRVGDAASRLAKACLLIYLFFLFFGTTLPFQEEIENLDDIAGENPVRQYVFSSVYVLSFIALLPKRNMALQMLKKEKFLGLFLFWSLATVFWSDFPFASIKGWIHFFGIVTVLVSALVYFESEDEAWRYVRAILLIYIPLSLLSVLLVPGATQWEFPAWRGLASHKNTFGQVSLLSLVIWYRAACIRGAERKKLSLLFCGLSLIMLLGSRSTTSLLTGGFLLLLASILYAEKILCRPVLGGFFSSLLVLLFFTCLFVVVYIESDAVNSIFEFFGKDATLTGRVDIWEKVIDEAKRHWIFGCGFQGFWEAGNPAVEALIKELEWTINHAHQGYLDILNETGIVGLSIFLMMMVRYFRTISTLERMPFGTWIVIAVLIFNLTESTVLRPHEVSGVLLLLAYLARYADAARADREVSRHEPSAIPVRTVNAHPPAPMGLTDR